MQWIISLIYYIKYIRYIKKKQNCFNKMISFWLSLDFKLNLPHPPSPSPRYPSLLGGLPAREVRVAPLVGRY